MSTESITCVDPNVLKALHKKEKKSQFLFIPPPLPSFVQVLPMTYHLYYVVAANDLPPILRYHGPWNPCHVPFCSSVHQFSWVFIFNLHSFSYLPQHWVISERPSNVHLEFLYFPVMNVSTMFPQCQFFIACVESRRLFLPSRISTIRRLSLVYVLFVTFSQAFNLVCYTFRVAVAFSSRGAYEAVPPTTQCRFERIRYLQLFLQCHTSLLDNFNSYPAFRYFALVHTFELTPWCGGYEKDGIKSSFLVPGSLLLLFLFLSFFPSPFLWSIYWSNSERFLLLDGFPCIQC